MKASLYLQARRQGVRGGSSEHPVQPSKDFKQRLAIHFKYPTVKSFVSGSLVSLPLRISALQTSLIVASTALSMHGGPAGECGTHARINW